MENLKVNIEVDKVFLEKIIKKSKLAARCLMVLDFVTFGLMHSRILHQYEILERLISEAVAESITVKKV